MVVVEAGRCGGVGWFRIEMLPSSNCNHDELERHMNDDLGVRSCVLMDAR